MMNAAIFCIKPFEKEYLTQSNKNKHTLVFLDERLLDVCEKEKGLFFYNHADKILQDDKFARLLTFKNVFITSHQTFLTREALGNIADTTIYNLDCFENDAVNKYELV